MPVRMAVPDEDSIGPYNRLSASQANTYWSCPRLWFYQKVYRFKMPQIPVLFVGRAVEEALCRVLRESPGLVAANAGPEALGRTPYDDDGVLATDASEWPAVGLLPLFPNERPKNLEDLEAWAIQRCHQHLPPALKRVRALWEKDDRKAGDWNTVNEQACLAMVCHGVRFHLEEVKRCFEANGGPTMQAWREGQRSAWPAPDGYPDEPFTGAHPLSETGELSWTEAWEISRPWFVDPDAPSFSLNAIHPEHWFQGEYDLVYRWTGTPAIVDIKASIGANDRSGDYVQQMRIYAMLWYVTHGRAEHVNGLQIWYLGHPSIKEIPVPSEEELNSIETELEEMWQALRSTQPSLEDCPPDPKPMRGFSPGGVPSEAPDYVRCDRCDWRSVCPGGEGDDEQPLSSSIQLPGSAQQTPLQRISTLNPRATVRGVLFTVDYVRENAPLKMTMKQGHHSAHIQIVASKHSDGEPTLGVPAVKGQAVVVEDAVFTINWKGEIVLKIDPFSRLLPDDDPGRETDDLFDIQAKHNIGGKVVYCYEKSGVGRTGKRWSRKGMMVMDGDGAIKVEGWADDWNPQYDLVEPGDVVVLANIGLDAWASDARGDYTRNSRLQIIERVDRSTT